MGQGEPHRGLGGVRERQISVAPSDPRVASARAEWQRRGDAYQIDRARFGTALFLVIYPCFAFFDFVVSNVLGLSPLLPLLALRLLPLPAGFVAYRRLRSDPPPSSTDVLGIYLLVGALVTLSMAGSAVLAGGLESPYQAGILYVPVWLVFLPMPFRRALVGAAMPVVIYVATMVAGAAFSLPLRAQWRDTKSLAVFGLNVALVATLCCVMAGVAHMLFTMRREIFESKSIGKYRLRRLLGSGGMAEVWAAWHEGLRREVALKILRPSGPEQAIPTRRFEREVEAMTRLTHPNTVRVFDFGTTDDGLLYYAMELLHGEHLGQLVERLGPLPPGRAKHFALQAARALAEVHSLGIVHRDVKPENLFVTTAGGEADFLKLLDFGIATEPALGRERLTDDGAVAGTPSTLSPEVIRGAEASPAADVYALGCVTYLMLAGRLPFESDQAMAIVLAHLGEHPRRPSRYRGESLPASLEEVVLRCLEKDPADRYADARDFVEALVCCVDVDASRHAPDSVPPSRSGEVERARVATGPTRKDIPGIKR
ncbi:MAG: serine/threonine-protein kinase [Polyangiales bacterium]